MKKKLLVIAAIVSGLTLLSFSPPADRYFEIAKNLEIMATLFREVNTFYVDDVNPNKLMRTGVDAMLNSLDPFTNYIPEDEVEDYRTTNTGQYGGIGAVTREIGNRMVVVMMYEGYPAVKKGLKIGDEIIKLDDITLANRKEDETNHLMRGQVGTSFSLTVNRYGVKDPIKLEFKREKIKISNVPYFGMISGHVGYVQLTDFTVDAAKEVQNAVQNLKDAGATSFIIDLRGNPGGILDEAVSICNIFLPKGKKVVQVKGKTPESKKEYATEAQPVDPEVPVAVLINRGSASASEIVAGTFQDYDRGVIIGEKSYGKGLVQISLPLSYNSLVKITTAKYYTPTGRCIQVIDYQHRRPDGSVLSVPDSLKKAFKTSRGRTVYDGGGIEPDVAVENPEAATVTEALFAQGLIFDYGTIYASRHPSIGDARSFSLPDAEYQDFVNWVRTKDLHYKSPVEVQLNKLTEVSKNERLYDELKPQIDQIQARLKENQKADLMIFKDQIKTLLEEEIVGRYFLERGQAEVTFKDDKEIRKAIEVLNNPVAYKKVLNL